MRPYGTETGFTVVDPEVVFVTTGYGDDPPVRAATQTVRETPAGIVTTTAVPGKDPPVAEQMRPVAAMALLIAVTTFAALAL